jgi:molybdopterin-containing oxidoreductase family iron-sulfur binding subunit
MYPPHEHADYQWAMVVDLDQCSGCGACVVACQIENNIPVVGSDEHLRGREMSWLRVEPRYEAGGTVSFTPMMCQHCHHAPCEPVCPVYATVHNEEGLNAQIYNRCVGTRYCANNCPYKARRFNWFDHPREEPLDKMVNPDMLVRGRGVMEKCTFCVQRIRAARDGAKDEQRKIRDGEVTPACAQTCPMNAIAFGNLKDRNSVVYELAHSERAFRVFEHLNTEPSVYYLRRRVRSA